MSASITIIAYLPVLHRGVVAWLSRYPGAEILVLGETMTQTFRPLQKDIRALSPAQIVTSLAALKLGQSARVIEAHELAGLSGAVVMADEALSRELAQTQLSHCQVTFDSVWLRWERSTITGERIVQPDLVWQAQALEKQRVSATDPDQRWLLTAELTALQSSDWWRQVGAVAVRTGQLLLQSYNHHLPSEHQPYIDGDPRAEAHQGEAIELSTAIHAEADLIATAAKQGLSLAGSTMFVTTFPCPPCAKLIVAAGITRLVYQTGYSLLAGTELFRSHGVELVQLSLTDSSESYAHTKSA